MNDQQQEILTKRFQTTMIGSLYEFEKNFGHLWGQEKNPDFLTESEEHFRDIWEITRNQILNNGNNQLRKCLTDMDRSINYKYHYKFYNQKHREDRI